MTTFDNSVKDIEGILICPRCSNSLKEIPDKRLQCVNADCGATYPGDHDIPIIVDDDRSVFSITDVLEKKDSFFNPIHNRSASNSFIGRLKRRVHRFIPSVSHNLRAAANYRKLADLLLKFNEPALVLVIGGRILGEGMEALAQNDRIRLVETDVSYGERTRIICDAHHLPFADNCFDGVIIQAVLEHVTDPYQSVSEIYRVLKKGGLVYAETPFMQQVHEGRYDFTRFTHRGHRRLFRHFEEIDSGAVSGPGMALAWSWRYFLVSFAKSRLMHSVLSVTARLTGFWLKYFDYFLLNRPAAIDGACGVFFMGRKSDKTLSDKELVQLY